MRNSTYYNLKLVEGTDIVNPLTTEVPNMIKIDETMHENAIAGVTLATELTNGTVHALMRENSDCAVIRFIATSEWKAGDSATVDGLPVTVLLPSGETLPDGAYVINANVLCILTGTNLTVYAERKNTENANAIAYNDTTVGAELTKLNSNLNNKIKLTTITGSTGTGSGAGLLSIPRTEYPNAIAIIPFAYDYSFDYRIGAYDISSNNFKFGVQKSVSGEWADTVTVVFYALVIE